MLLDKAKFPRDKFCGDAVIPRAQHHLKRMGVLDQMIDAGECLFTTSGGFVSPAGVECLSDSTENPSGTPLSVKRIIMDERIVRAAQSAGAEQAAETLIEAFRLGRFDEQFLSAYQDKWHKEFGNKFGLAKKASLLMARYPELVDAMAKVANERDDAFFFAWADIMMGEAPWSDFLKPKLAIPLAAASLRELWTQRVSPLRSRVSPSRA